MKSPRVLEDGFSGLKILGILGFSGFSGVTRLNLEIENFMVSYVNIPFRSVIKLHGSIFRALGPVSIHWVRSRAY
jgi:hypothetical protein